METATLALKSKAASAKLANVQAARGVAALMVVVYHATRSVSLPQYLGYIPFGNAFGFGHAGVDFFFVLSGFIITHAHTADIGRPERLYRYLWRRITRIYPIYWVVTAIVCLSALFSPDAAVRLSPSHVLYSLLLLPENMEPVVSVAWTLRSEMLFYLIFAFAVIDRRFCRPLIIGTILLVLLGLGVTHSGVWTNLLLSSFNIQFLIGIATARFLVLRQVPHPAIVAAIGMICFLAVGVLEVHGLVPLNGFAGRMLYGGASAAILLGLVEVERQGTFRVQGAGMLFGDTSYSLYLIHLTIIPITARGCAAMGVLALPPVSIMIAALVALSLAGAIGLHLAVEVPIARVIRRHTPRALR